MSQKKKNIIMFFVWLLVSVGFIGVLGNLIFGVDIVNGESESKDITVFISFIVFISGIIFRKKLVNRILRVTEKKTTYEMLGEQEKLLMEHDISEIIFYKAIMFFYRDAFKKILNPMEKEDLKLIKSEEFKFLNDIGLVTQDSEFPYLFTIDTNEEIKKTAFNFDCYIRNSPLYIPDFSNFDNLKDGFEFENYIADLLKKLDYNNVKVLPMSNDYGADVLAEFNNVKYAIQCKYYYGPVGISAIQEVIGAKRHYKAQVAVVATNNTFTSNSENLAKSNNVILWNRTDLLRMAQQAR